MASIKEYDPDLAGDTVTATKKKQSSFDQTNLPPQYQQPAAAPAAPSGPLGRVAQQLPATAITAPAPAPSGQSLADGFNMGIGDGRRAIYAGVGANGEASFSDAPSSFNSLSKNFTAPNQAPGQRLSSMPDLASAGGGTQQPAQRFPTSLADMSPGGPQNNVTQQPQRSASLTDALPGYQPPSATQASAAQQQANLAEAWRGGSSTGPGFAALGSSANVGDGVGSFSQANQGDAALAMGRFQKAIDLRNGYADQDRLRNAVAAQTRDNNFTVVHDSSRPVTQRELKFDRDRALTTQNLANAVTGAQSLVDAQRQGVAANQQQRQANRLEDAWSLAVAPNATPEDKQAYDRLTDPTGDRAMKRQQQQADVNSSIARAAKDNSIAEANGRKVKGLPAGLQKFEDEDIEAIGTSKNVNESLERINTQIADGSLQLSPLANATSSVKNALGVSDEASTNYASFLATLEKMRNDTLRLNKGTQTEGDAGRAWNELFTNIKDPKIVQQRIKEIAGYNNAASALSVDKLNNRRRNQGLDDVDVSKLFGSQGQTPQQRPQQSQQSPPQERQTQAQPTQQAPGPKPVYRISSDEQFARLPSGADFIDPQGNHRRKP